MRAVSAELFMAALFSWTAYAETGAPSFDFKLATPAGKVVQQPRWPQQAKWFWSRPTPEFPVGVPRLRIYFQLPSYLKLDPADPLKASRIVTPGSPWIGVDLSETFESVPLLYKPSSGGATEWKVNLLISAESARTPFFLDPGCKNLGVSASPESDATAGLFVALACAPQDGAIELYVLHSREAELSQAEGLGTPLSRAPQWTRYRVSRPVAGSWILVSSGARAGRGAYRISSTPTVAASSASRHLFGGEIGLGVTQLSYSEPTAGVKLSQSALTAKASATLGLIPPRWELSVNGFGTAAILAHSPADLMPASFYGINGRIGYAWPGALGGNDLVLSMGAYYWVMHVSANPDPTKDYGIDMLGGTEAFLVLRHRAVGSRGYSVYLKFAPISDSIAIKPADRELALGCALQLTSPQATRSWNLTLDLSDARFRTSDGLHVLSLDTATLGISLGL